MELSILNQSLQPRTAGRQAEERTHKPPGNENTGMEESCAVGKSGLEFEGSEEGAEKETPSYVSFPHQGSAVAQRSCQEIQVDRDSALAYPADSFSEETGEQVRSGGHPAQAWSQRITGQIEGASRAREDRSGPRSAATFDPGAFSQPAPVVVVTPPRKFLHSARLKAQVKGHFISPWPHATALTPPIRRFLREPSTNTVHKTREK